MESVSGLGVLDQKSSFAEKPHNKIPEINMTRTAEMLKEKYKETYGTP